jgi:hypothetical protein
MAEQNITEEPEPDKKDLLYTITKAGLSAIPIIGGPAAEIFGAVLEPPLSKRRAEWMDSIAEGLLALEEKVDGFEIENLSNEPEFITTVMHASQIAVRNHQRDKLDALRNAVLNTAVHNAPEEDIQLMFLEFIDVLTPWHLRILRFFQNPSDWAKNNNLQYPNWEIGRPLTFLRHAFPELTGREDFYELLIKDLFNRGLLQSPNLNEEMAAEGLLMSRTTSFGNRFIAYIKTPTPLS